MAKANSRGNILVLSAQVPFTRGGAELLVDNLVAELKLRDFDVDTVSLPFSAQPVTDLVKQVRMWRALDLSCFGGREVDLVIGTKFPTYCVKHPRKSLWLIHQHRQLYDLYGTRFGDITSSLAHEALRRLLSTADCRALEECQTICTISKTVSSRLEQYCGFPSKVLEPPLPYRGKYFSKSKKNYILSVGRLCSMKRVDLLIKALPEINSELTVKIVGAADEPRYEDYLVSEIGKHHLWHRVEFLGRVPTDRLLELYSEAYSVYYAPYDEDYGFVTLEAMASGCPVVTAVDSGSVLAFVEHEKTGLVVAPNVEDIASGFNRLWTDKVLYQNLAANCNHREDNTWDFVIEQLVSPIAEEKLTANI